MLVQFSLSLLDISSDIADNGVSVSLLPSDL